MISKPERVQGRGRLSSIDQLPDACEPDIVWALEQLEARKEHSNTILREFNARIADKGAGKISPQAWSRWSIRKALQLRRMQEGRAIMSGTSMHSKSTPCWSASRRCTHGCAPLCKERLSPGKWNG